MDLPLLSQLRAEDGGSTYMWLNLYPVIYAVIYGIVEVTVTKYSTVKSF